MKIEKQILFWRAMWIPMFWFHLVMLGLNLSHPNVGGILIGVFFVPFSLFYLWWNGRDISPFHLRPRQGKRGLG